MTQSPVLGLDELADGQSGAATTHNQALRALEAIVARKVIDRDLTAPPGSPTNGDTYIPAATATGAWAGKEGQLATADSSQPSLWKFTAPVEGIRAWLADEKVDLIYHSSAWRALTGTQSLTDGATINWNGALGAHAKVTLGGNRTLAAPTNLVQGVVYTLRVGQDDSGSRTLTWNAAFKFPSATAPTLSTGINKVDLFSFLYDGTNLLNIAQAIDVR